MIEGILLYSCTFKSIQIILSLLPSARLLLLVTLLLISFTFKAWYVPCLSLIYKNNGGEIRSIWYYLYKRLWLIISIQSKHTRDTIRINSMQSFSIDLWCTLITQVSSLWKLNRIDQKLDSVAYLFSFVILKQSSVFHPDYIGRVRFYQPCILNMSNEEKEKRIVYLICDI